MWELQRENPTGYASPSRGLCVLLVFCAHPSRVPVVSHATVLPFPPHCCQCPAFPLPQPVALGAPPVPLGPPAVMLCISPAVFSLSILSFLFSQPVVQVVSSRMGKTCKAELARQGEVEMALRIEDVDGSLEESWKIMVTWKWLKKKAQVSGCSLCFLAFFSNFQPVKMKCSSKMWGLIKNYVPKWQLSIQTGRELLLSRVLGHAFLAWDVLDFLV